MNLVHQWSRACARCLFSALLPVVGGAVSAQLAPCTDRVGTLHAQDGDHGRSAILIPGLQGGSWVWRDTIAKPRQNHVV